MGHIHRAKLFSSKKILDSYNLPCGDRVCVVCGVLWLCPGMLWESAGWQKPTPRPGVGLIIVKGGIKTELEAISQSCFIFHLYNLYRCSLMGSWG